MVDDEVSDVCDLVNICVGFSLFSITAEFKRGRMSIQVEISGQVKATTMDGIVRNQRAN